MIPDCDKLLLHYTLNDLAKAVWYYCVIAMAWLLLYGIISNVFSFSLDDSDKDAWHRSGVAVVTDYKTGQQYLKTPEGFLTPRLGVK